MNYRFKGTDYTEDQMSEVAGVKGYTLDELISKNPQIEIINEKEDDVLEPLDLGKEVEVEKPAPVEIAPAATEIKSDGVSKPEDTSLELEKNKKVEPVKVEEKPKVDNLIYPEATNTKELEKAFEKEYNVKYKNIQKAVDADVLKADQNFKNELDKYFSEGIDKYKAVNEDGTEYLNFNLLERDAYNSAVEKYKKEIENINTTYSKDKLNDYVERYNSFLGEESRKQLDQLLVDTEKGKQDLIDFEKKLYFRYNKDGELLGIHNYDSIYQTYVAPKRLKYEEYVSIPGNENKTRKEYKKTSNVLPSYDSVEDYVEQYNKWKNWGQGYMVESRKENLLPELVVETTTKKSDINNRVDYWNNEFSGPAQAIFNDFDDNTAARILKNLLPETFDVSPYNPLKNQISITNTKTDESYVIDVFADGKKAIAKSQSSELAGWLAANTTNEDIDLTNKRKEDLNKFLLKAQSESAYDANGDLTGGLNVESKRLPFTSEYSASPVSDLNDFSVDMSLFAVKKTPAYSRQAMGTITGMKVQEEVTTPDRQRKAQQASFNAFIQTVSSNGKPIGVSGEINYSTMPTYEQSLKTTNKLMDQKMPIDSYTEIPSTYQASPTSSPKEKQIIEYSKQNKEALFYYDKSNGEKVLFDTKKWSEENDGKNFTEFISRKAVNEIIVPQDLIEEEKSVFEKAIGMDFLGDQDLNKQAKIILANINVNKKVKNEIASTKYIQKTLENKLKNTTFYNVETAQAILNIPGYEVEMREGEDIVEVETNYGEKVLAPKWIFDNAKLETTNFLSSIEAYKENNEAQSKLIDVSEKAEDKWDIYRLNYSDTEANLQNFALSTGDFLNSALYGGVKYLSPFGWAMTALSAKAGVQDPLTDLMLGFKDYGDKQRSYYNAPPEFGKFKTAAEFGSWFFNMAGTQVPQYATMLFSGGSASLPLIFMGASATGSTDLDFRREVISGTKDYNEFGIMWRAVLSGGSEALFAGLPTWKILNKGKSLVSGLGGDATSKFFKGGKDYLRAQVPGIIKDTSVDAGFEVVNGVVQNLLAGRPSTQGLGEIAATSILMTGPVSTLSPTYYALTTKDFIGGNLKQSINENTWKINQIEQQNKSYFKSIQKFMKAATLRAGTSDGRFAKQKVQELKNKILENVNIKINLETDVKSDYKTLDNLFKNKGVNPAGSANYNFMLNELVKLKSSAKEINLNNNLTASQKTDLLDKVNAQYVAIDQAKEKYLDPKTYGDAWYALKGAGIFDLKAKRQYKEYISKATQNLQESGVTNDNMTNEKIEQEARLLYHDKIAEDQLAKDKKVRPELKVARTLEEAKNIINSSETLSEDQKKNLISKLEKGTQNGFTIDEFEFAYKPNMVKNSMFHTGSHEISHYSSAELITRNPQAFKGFADQLVSFMETDHAELLEYAKQVNANLFKDGKYDPEEVIATFIELVGADKIKMNKNGNVPALLGFLFNKSLNNASEGEYNIPFNGQDDIVNWFIGLGKALTNGDVTVGKYTDLLAGALDIDLETGKVIPITDQTSKLAASEASVSSSETTLLEAINNLLPEDIDTKEKYDNFIRDERKAKPVVDALNKPGGAINNYIRSKQVSPEEGNEMIQNTLFRLFNFNPEETRADGSIVGPEAFGERIFSDTRFASMDARKKLAKEAEKKKQEDRIDSEEAKQVAAKDDTTPVNTAKDKVTPKSKIPKEFPEVFDKEIKKEFETAGLEIYESDIPDISKKEFKSVITELFRGKLTKKVKDKLGTGKNYSFVVKKMAPMMKDLLPIQWFVRLESQTKPEDRIFTKPPTRLTKQTEIDSAILDEKVYAENIAQGVNVYEFKDFKPKELIDYLLPPLKITSAKTGKEVRSGLRGNRKTTFAEGLTDRLGRDVSPSSAEAVGKTPKEIAEISRKLQVDPRIKFSEVHNDIRKAYGGQLEYFDAGNYKEAAKSVNKVRDFVIDVLAPILGGDVYNLIDSNNLAPIGNRWFKNVGRGLFMGDVFPMSKKNIDLYNETVDINKTLVAQGVLGTLKDLVADVEASSGIKKGEQKTNTSKILAKQDLSKLEDNLNNLTQNQKDVEVVIKAFKKAYDSDNSLLPVIKEFLYNPLASRMWGKNAALVRSTIDGILKGDKKYEEHTYQFGNWALRTGQAIKSKNKDVYNGWLKWQRDNYYQTVFDRKTLMMGSPYQTKALSMGTVFIPVDPTIMDYQNIVDKKYVKDGVLWEAQSGEHPLLKQKLDEAFKTGDFSKVPPSEIRFFNEYFSLNPFTLRLDGNTFAEKYGLKIDDALKSNTDIAKFAGDLIYKQILTKSGELIGDNAMTPKKAQDMLDEAIPVLLAETNAKNKVNVPLVRSSEVMNMKNSENMGSNDVINKTKTLDKALENANSLNKPIKKIRVFDFDDTLATSKNIVIATKDGKTIKLNAEDFAKKGLELKEDGWDMDFSDFNKVTDGGRGPLFKVAEKIKNARGNEDLFVLTARAPESREAIYEFLKEEGLEFKKENIIGLGNSTGEAKAQWLVGKAAEGYNDFYFADDAAQNVSAVKESMNLLGVKSKIQLAKENKIKFSETSTIKKLNWKTDEANNIKTTFNIGDKKYNINLDSRDDQGSFDLEFDLNGRKDITGTGDSVKVIKTVYNGLLNIIDQNKSINKIEFSSRKSEQSRVKLYTTLMDRLGKKLGWKTDIWESNDFITPEDSSYDFELVKPRKKQVTSVEKVLNVVDVKSETQKARIKSSEILSEQFNKLIEEATGIEYFKEYSAAKAKTIGASKGKFKFFIPYSAEDFLGLIYPTLAKGSKGDAQMAWYKENLLNPYTKAQDNLSMARVNLMQDFKQLKKSLDVPADLKKKNKSGFSNEQAVRVYLWDKQGYDVPGISKSDLKELKSLISNDPKLSLFADQILSITKGDGYTKPGENWLSGTITTDLIDLINTEKRSKYLAEWQQNADAIYSKENLNKLEAAYGTKYVESLKGILARMKSGRNRLDTGNRLSNQILDYINGSVGTIMFFNTRSALLQTISSINFINWNFNNPLLAGKAFANQPQFWKDFKLLMNSDYLKDRRNGLKLNISESEIADAASTSKNKTKAVLNYILQKGYLPTQFADSFAIASGGATFYRNRINDLMKNQNMSEADASAQALIEWRQIAEESQQSSDPSKISSQQSSNVGRVILAFANTPMQYARIQKRAIQDLINGRGDAKSNISKIIYYGFVQNIIFNALQQAAYAIGFGDDVDDEVKEKKYLSIANGMLDSLLRGLGIAGQAVSVGKNFLLDLYERSGRDRPEYVDSVWKLTQFSPPINSKISKLKQAAWHFDSKARREKIFNKGFALDNPAYEAGAKVISATTNVPLDRVLLKMENIEGALNEDNDLWQRIAMLGGWPKWQLETKNKKQSSSSKNNKKGNLKIKGGITFRKKKIKIK